MNQCSTVDCYHLDHACCHLVIRFVLLHLEFDHQVASLIYPYGFIIIVCQNIAFVESTMLPDNETVISKYNNNTLPLEIYFVNVGDCPIRNIQNL